MSSDQAGITEFTVWVDEADDGCVVNDDAFTSGCAQRLRRHRVGRGRHLG